MHVIDAGEEGSKDPQHGNETPEEHHLRPVPVEEILAKAQPVLLEPNVASVPFHQPVATRAADPVSDVVPQDRARRRGDDDPEDREPPRRAGIDGGGDQHGLARHRDADALDADEDEDGEVTIGRQQGVEVAREEAQHSGRAYRSPIPLADLAAGLRLIDRVGSGVSPARQAAEDQERNRDRGRNHEQY